MSAAFGGRGIQLVWPANESKVHMKRCIRRGGELHSDVHEVLKNIMVSSGEVTLCFDAFVLAEYSEVSCRSKFGFDKDKVTALLDHIEHRGHIVASSPLLHSLPDPNDEAFLKVAIAGKAVGIVTGNTSHFPSKLCQCWKVLSPSEFLTFYKKQQKLKSK